VANPPPVASRQSVSEIQSGNRDTLSNDSIQPFEAAMNRSRSSRGKARSVDALGSINARTNAANVDLHVPCSVEQQTSNNGGAVNHRAPPQACEATALGACKGSISFLRVGSASGNTKTADALAGAAVLIFRLSAECCLRAATVRMQAVGRASECRHGTRGFGRPCTLRRPGSGRCGAGGRPLRR
jgi:hypothetical protein